MNKLKLAYRNIGLKKKLVFTTASFIIFCVLAISGYVYQLIQDSKKDLFYSQLKSIRESKSRQIESYFDQARNQILVLSNNLMTIEAMQSFSDSFYTIPNEEIIDNNDIRLYQKSLYQYYKKEYQPRARYVSSVEPLIPQSIESKHLQYHYIAANQYPTKNKEKLNHSEDGSGYSLVHKKYHSQFRQYLNGFGYYDIFLVNSHTGDVVYSVYKEIDFATNLLSGPHKSSNLAELFREVRLATKPDFVKLVDFKAYQPSYGSSASFIASPILKNGKNIGVLIFQMPIDEINNIMTGSENWYLDGLGLSGEAVIVGSDGRLRSQSRFVIEDGENFIHHLAESNQLVTGEYSLDNSHLLMLPVDIKSFTKGGNFYKGEKEIIDYRNKTVLAAYLPLNIKDVNWGFLAKIDTEEIYTILRDLHIKTAFYCLLFILILLPCLFYFANTIAKPLENLRKLTKSILNNNFENRFQYESNDVLGKLSKDINYIAESLAFHQKELKEIFKSENYIPPDLNHTQCTLNLLTSEISQLISQKNKENQHNISSTLAACNDLHASNGELISLVKKEKTIRDSIYHYLRELAPQQVKAEQTKKNISIEWEALRKHFYKAKKNQNHLRKLIKNMNNNINKVENIHHHLHELVHNLKVLSVDSELWTAISNQNIMSKRLAYIQSEIELAKLLGSQLNSHYLRVMRKASLNHHQCDQQVERSLEEQKQMTRNINRLTNKLNVYQKSSDSYHTQMAQLLGKTHFSNTEACQTEFLLAKAIRIANHYSQIQSRKKSIN